MSAEALLHHGNRLRRQSAARLEPLRCGCQDPALRSRGCGYPDPKLVLRGVLGAWSTLGPDARIHRADMLAAWSVADPAERAELARVAQCTEVWG